jgi:hypothetical protein
MSLRLDRREAIYKLIRTDIVESLIEYGAHGRATGGFLEAVLSNDLKKACARADDENRWALWLIVYWICNEMPAEAWGSGEKVKRWIAMGGMTGQLEGEEVGDGRP